MKKNVFLLAFICLLGWACNSEKKDPGKVAENFYKYLNNGKIDEAKALAAPSAKEWIDKLKELDVFKSKGDTIPFELMDIKKQESPKEGDTAIVNYKIGKFKDFIKLVYIDGAYKVIYTNELRVIRIVEFYSYDFCDMKNNKTNITWENYSGMRIRLKSLLYHEAYLCYAFNKIKNIIYAAWFEVPNESFFLCNKTLNPIDGGGSLNIDFIDGNQENLLTKCECPLGSNYKKFYSSFDFEGVLTGPYFAFSNVSVFNVENCK
jgi:hypothetical protein